jgi:hypothetical protein
VADVAASRTGDADTGQIVQLTVAMNEGVTVNPSGGPTTLTLNDGATATYDAPASTPSSGILVFDDTVSATDQTSDLEVVAVNLPTGTSVQDSNGVNVDFSAALNSPTGLSVNSPLRVASIATSVTGQVAAGQTIQISLAMNEAFQTEPMVEHRPFL